MKTAKKALIIIVLAAVILAIFGGANLLNIYVPAENLTSYTEYDPFNDLTITSNQVAVTDLQKREDPYCRKDFGIPNSMWDGDFEVYLHAKISYSESTAIAGLWMATTLETSNSLYDTSNANDGLVFYVFRYTEGTPANDLHRFILYDRTSTKPIQESYLDYSPYAVASTNVDYWFTITRYGSELTLSVYSNSARTSLIQQSTYIFETITTYRYAYVAYGYGLNSSTGGATIALNTSDYYFQEPPPFVPPIAVFTWSPAYPVINEAITFDGSQSSTNGTITNYEWDWENDGTFDYSSATSSTAIHAYSTSGSKTICLRVTDNYGQIGTVVHSVTVQTSAPTTYMLTVHTKDSSGTIIPSATVTVTPGGFSQSSSNIGIAEFELEPGTYTVQVSAFGFNSWTDSIIITASDAEMTSANTPEGVIPPTNDTPGFEMVVLIAGIFIAILLVRRKKPE